LGDFPQDAETQIKFSLRSLAEEAVVPVKAVFQRPQSKLSDQPGAYWRCGRRILKTKRGLITVSAPRSTKQLVRTELGCLRRIWRTPGPSRSEARKAALLRMMFWLTRPFLRNQGKVWLMFDKLFKGGDNGEYLYKYARNQEDGIRKYYVLNGDSPDAGRLKREGVKFVRGGSIHNRLVLLNAQLVFATHISIPSINGFSARIEPYFRGLFNYDVMFIQHGLTVQDLPQYQHIAFEGVRRYFVASKFETANLLQASYGYSESDLVNTGLARYDGLQNNDRKIVLISPSWRNYLAEPGVAFKMRGRDAAFTRSPYFKVYNRLINDERLLACAQETGYTVAFLPHPIVGPQISDFQHKPGVSVIDPNSPNIYERLLSESSLMVTDYSGVQFDFAYMYKPVVYYHPKALPPSYDEAIYNYDHDSLGDIMSDHDSLVDCLIAYMRANCRMKPKYRKRVDKFFYFHDDQNCKRTYDAAIEYLQQHESAH
jgi:hypothetical protein